MRAGPKLDGGGLGAFANKETPAGEIEKWRRGEVWSREMMKLEN